ncbi:hypothetical protein BDU57DRAFT_87173 [Ampelomyces quisqualis]|uniref:Uncharacterized protein n=1 Tax=Ampelomyces quisqualis TaxID=50730 RepID=A0A6A5QAL8_AMPQU|nr:hypothetical protein BDU57DRAFT_87173 [Ampelomyces quisqualis]
MLSITYALRALLKRLTGIRRNLSQLQPRATQAATACFPYPGPETLLNSPCDLSLFCTKKLSNPVRPDSHVRVPVKRAGLRNTLLVDLDHIGMFTTRASAIASCVQHVVTLHRYGLISRAETIVLQTFFLSKSQLGEQLNEGASDPASSNWIVSCAMGAEIRATKLQGDLLEYIHGCGNIGWAMRVGSRGTRAYDTSPLFCVISRSAPTRG